MTGERRPRLAIVLEAQPPEFASHDPDRYVWVRYLDTGRNDGWRPDHIHKAPQEQYND